MKKSLMLLLCAVLSHLAVAQSGRFVNGVVFDENDSPMAGVMVGAKGDSEGVVTGPDGQFKLTVSAYTKYLTAQAEGYFYTKCGDRRFVYRLPNEDQQEVRRAEGGC